MEESKVISEYDRGYKDGLFKRNTVIKKASWKTSFMVFLYAGIMIFCLLLQTAFLLGIKLDLSWCKYFNESFVLPINNMTLLWTIVCSSYIGVDRAAYCVRSAEMAKGESDVGDPGKLRLVIVLTILVFFIAVAGNIFVNADFDLTTLSTAIGTSISLYIAGQKAITLCKNVNGKTIPSEKVDLEEK